MESSSRSRSRSPVKQGTPKDKARRSRSLSPVKSAGRAVPGLQHDEDSCYSSGAEQSFTYGNNTRIDYAASPSKLAQRRQVATPSPIDTIAANQQARAVAIRRAGIPSIIEHRASRVLEDPAAAGPSSSKFKPTFTGEVQDDSSSTYSIRPDVLSPAPDSARPQPLFTKQASQGMESNNAVFTDYQDWQRGRDLRTSGYNLLSDSDKKGPEKQVIGLERKPTKAGYRGEPYTPLSFWFPEGTGQRKASKTMIGAKGWLEDTTNSPDKKTPTSKKSFFTNFMSKAKAIVSLLVRPFTPSATPNNCF